MSRDVREVCGAWQQHQRHSFLQPSPGLTRHVARYWAVSWEYAEPYRQLIVPYPNVHLTFQGGRALVTGVSSGHQFRVLSGRSGVLGVAFRPGCFRPFLGAAVSTITDRTIDAREVFGPALPSEPDVPAVERLLREHAPEPDPKAELAAGVVALVIARPEITRVDALAAEFGTSVRQLQRLFAEYVGIGPKWVIRRYRLHEVTERMAQGAELDWAGLAVELGYADQAHLVRDFKALFGETPTRYAARY
ncbi:helix-turn-helix domain-containing protein [Saccharopolyspora sp. NPDC000359]|uniref:helix-turn-helix domain-containing protein n=1 Tax=Saccharopolyspora sp. NPDC000359 TaxID=3154251 RepID=UPI00332EF07B